MGFVTKLGVKTEVDHHFSYKTRPTAIGTEAVEC
jgi:hypothetical protein